MCYRVYFNYDRHSNIWKAKNVNIKAGPIQITTTFAEKQLEVINQVQAVIGRTSELIDQVINTQLQNDTNSSLNIIAKEAERKAEVKEQVLIWRRSSNEALIINTGESPEILLLNEKKQQLQKLNSDLHQIKNEIESKIRSAHTSN